MAPTRSQARRTALPLVLLAAAALAAAPPQSPPRAGEGGEAAPGTVTVAPDSVRAGGHVELTVDVCEGDSAVAHADAFESDVELRPGTGGGLAARATVRGEAQAGPYTVTADCAERPGAARGSFTVVGGHTPASPSAPVRAGGGGMAGETGDGGGGFSTGGGAALGLAAAAAIGAAVLRGRRPPHPDGSGGA